MKIKRPSLNTLARFTLVLAFLGFRTFIASADSSTWRLQFYGEAPCYSTSGKQVFTLASSFTFTIPFPGYSISEFLQDLASGGGQLPLVDNAGHSTFDVSGCGADPIHSTEQATFAFVVNPGGKGIYYVQTNNYVNDNFCGGNTVNVILDPDKQQIQGNYVDTVGTTRCSVALAAPGAPLPNVNPTQPTDPTDPDCPASPQPCPLHFTVPITLKDAAEKKFYETILTATGGTKPYQYQILPADPPFPLDFPKGLSYKQFGNEFVISGTPAGNYPDDYIFGGDSFDFKIRVTDHAGDSVTQLTSLRVVPPLSIHPTWRPILMSIATEGVAYFDFVTANGGDNLSYTKHWTLAGNVPPPGIKLAETSGPDLIFRGKPAAGSHGTYTFQVKVDDGFSYPDLQTVVINVFPAKTQPLKITTSTLPAVTQGDSVSDQIGASGGAGNYAWTLTSSPPPGLTLSAQGILSGHASKGADAGYTFAVKVKDSDGKTATGSIVIHVNPPAGSALHFNSTTVLSEAYAGSAFNAGVPALGGIPPYTVSLDRSSPALPPGLKLSPEGVISGTPEKAESVVLIFSVKDSKGKTSKKTFKLVVSGDKPPAITSLSPESETVDSPAFTLRVKGSGFKAGAAILWNGETLPTQHNGSELSALVPAELLTIPGFAQVAVQNGPTSLLDPLPFAVLSTQPSTLIAPLAGTNLSDTVQFQWIRSTSSQYRVQIGDHGVGTNNLFDMTLSSTTAFVSAAKLPVDGRTLYVRLGSHLHDGWHYRDYTFSTIRSALTSRAKATVTLNFKNSLLYPVDITVNGTVLGAVKASSTAQQSVTFTAPLMVSIEMERPRTPSGQPLGEEFKGFFSPIASPAKIENFEINNKLGAQLYFIPIINNTTSQDRVLGVNMDLEAENRCNCVIPAHGSSVAAGYYQLFTNSNVRLYLTSSPYSGSYLYWGSPDGTSKNSFVSAVEQKTGRLLLTAK